MSLLPPERSTSASAPQNALIVQQRDKMTNPKNQEGREMLEAVKGDARASKQVLLLAHM